MITIGLDEVVALDDVALQSDADIEAPSEATRRAPRGSVATSMGLKMVLGGILATSMTIAIPQVVDATPIRPPGDSTPRGRDATTAPHVTAPGDVRTEFHLLAAQWRAETMFSSSLTEQYEHPAYQRIIDLGKAAVPSLLEEMIERPDHWGYALTKITGEDPVPQDAHGRLRAVADAWVAWGKMKGLIV